VIFTPIILSNALAATGQIKNQSCLHVSQSMSELACQRTKRGEHFTGRNLPLFFAELAAKAVFNRK